MTHCYRDYPGNPFFSLTVSRCAAFFEYCVVNPAVMQTLASDLILYGYGGFSSGTVAELRDNLKSWPIVLTGR